MANILTVTAETLPGPSNNRNAAATFSTGSATTATPTTGQIWPRGAG